MTCTELSQEGAGRLWPGWSGSSWLFLPNGKNWGRSIHLLNPRSGQHRGLYPASQKLSRAVAKSNALEAERAGFKSGPATSHLCAGDWSLPLPDAQFPLPGGCVKSWCVKPEQSSWWHTEDPPCGHIYECAQYCRLVSILCVTYFIRSRTSPGRKTDPTQWSEHSG